MTDKNEVYIRKAEMLLDSGTQKILRSLAYVRVLRAGLAKQEKSLQWTLTHPQQSKRMGGTDYGNKKWSMRGPKMRNGQSIEYGLFAECWHCNAVFQKTIYCQKCGFFVCPHCNKCACQLPDCCKNVAKKFLRAISGEVPPLPSKL